MTQDQLLQLVDGIRVDRSHFGPALKKPLLLLLICSRLSKNPGQSNEFKFEEIREELGYLIRNFGGRMGQGGPKPEQPFYYLKSDGFWSIRWPEGQHDPGNPLIGILTHAETLASLSPEAFDLLSKNSAARSAVAQALLQKWIPDALQEELIEYLGFNLAQPGTLPAGSELGPRSAEFRIGVKRNFRERCAFCRFQARFLDLAFGLESAHIRFRKFEGPDEIDNGLALCRLHHIAFDRGVLGVSKELKILVSPALIAQDDISKTLIEALRDQKISDWKDTPPRPEYLEWHRDEVFQGWPG